MIGALRSRFLKRAIGTAFIDIAIRSATIVVIAHAISSPLFIYSGFANTIGPKGITFSFVMNFAMVIGLHAREALLNPRPHRLIELPPGRLLIEITNTFCRAATLQLVTQMVADMRVEHFELIKEGRTIKARWIKLLHYLAMARALTSDRLFGKLFNYLIGALRVGK